MLSQTVPRGIRLVHLSVDLVFSGERDGGYVEDDPIDPVTVYGKTMAEGEQLILAADPTACILRISLPMGVSFNGHAGAIDWITSRMKKSRPATLYFDEVRTPTYTDCMNPLYEVMLASRMCGDLSRRRAAAAEPLSNRADHQPRRRLRSEAPARHSSPPGGPDPAAGRQRLAWTPASSSPRWATTLSTPGRWTMHLMPTDRALACSPRGGRSRLGGAALSPALHQSRPAEWPAADRPPLAALCPGAAALGHGLKWLERTWGLSRFSRRRAVAGNIRLIAAKMGLSPSTLRKGTVPFSSDENRDSPPWFAAKMPIRPLPSPLLSVEFPRCA